MAYAEMDFASGGGIQGIKYEYLSYQQSKGIEYIKNGILNHYPVSATMGGISDVSEYFSIANGTYITITAKKRCKILMSLGSENRVSGIFSEVVEAGTKIIENGGISGYWAVIMAIDA